MNPFELILLGIIQGLSEFLPISSSGHLALIQFFLEIDQIFLLTISVHFGTLLSLFVFYRHTFINIFKNSIKTPQQNLFLKIMVASLPTFGTGFFFYETIKNIFNEMSFIALGFLMSGIFLLGTYWKKPEKELDLSFISYKQAFIIGLSQIFALIPGVSRSGITISTGIFVNLNPAQAVRFSFLMAVITLSGACFLEFSKLKWDSSLVLPLFICISASFVVGYLALHLMKLWAYHLYKFSFYLLPLGLILFIYSSFFS